MKYVDIFVVLSGYNYIYNTFLFSQLSIVDYFVHYKLEKTVHFTVKVLLFCFLSRILFGDIPLFGNDGISITKYKL